MAAGLSKHRTDGGVLIWDVTSQGSTDSLERRHTISSDSINTVTRPLQEVGTTPTLTFIVQSFISKEKSCKVLNVALKM